jgi:hypothetical protein
VALQLAAELYREIRIYTKDTECCSIHPELIMVSRGSEDRDGIDTGEGHCLLGVMIREDDGAMVFQVRVVRQSI